MRTPYQTFMHLLHKITGAMAGSDDTRTPVINGRKAVGKLQEAARNELKERTRIVRRIFARYMAIFVLAALFMILFFGLSIHLELQSIKCP